MSSVSRRDFLKTTLAGGLSVSLAGWGARSFAHSRILGANDDIRVGFVGFRSKGAQHIEVFREIPGVRVVALCDVDQEILDRELEKSKALNESVTAYRDVRALLDNKDIDAVVVATPNHWHSLIGVWACQAGKDAYVEKPISHNIWEGRKLVEAARKYNRIVQAGTQNRSDTGFREAVAYLKEGHLGKPLWAHGVWFKERDSIGKVSKSQPVPETVDYDLWLGPAKKEPLMRANLHYDWHWFWEYGNGDMGNLGAHQIDDIRFAFNLDKLPRRVMSYGGRFVFDDNGETPNTQVGVYDYPDFPVLIETRNLPMAKGRRAMDHLRGARDGANVFQFENGYLVGGRGGATIYDKAGTRLQQFPGDGGGTHQANFIEAVRSRKREQLHAEIYEGHISAVLCHMANISYQIGKATAPEAIKEMILDDQQGRETLERIKDHLAKNEVNLAQTPLISGPWITLDQEQERFVGSFAKQANGLVKRKKYRKPFGVPDKV